MKKGNFMRRFFASKIFLLIGLVILGFLLFAFGKKFFEGREIDGEIKIAEEEIARLEAEDNQLDGLFNYLNTDIFLEEEARLRFNLQKEGESVMVFPESKAEETSKEGAVAERGEDVGNPKKWWNYFFKS